MITSWFSEIDERSFITWCKQHMSALDSQHMEGTEVSYSPLARSIASHHSCFHWSLEHTLGLCQRRRSLFGSGGCNIQSSGTHDTPWSIQKDSHSVRASSALNHVTWRSRQHKAPRDHEDFVWKDTHCRYWPHIQHRTHIPRLDCHRYTCRTLDCVEDKGSLLHHLGDCTIHLPLNLRMTNYKFTKVHHSPIKCTHNKFHFLIDWQHNRVNYCYDKQNLLYSNCNVNNMSLRWKVIAKTLIICLQWPPPWWWWALPPIKPEDDKLHTLTGLLGNITPLSIKWPRHKFPLSLGDCQYRRTKYRHNKLHITCESKLSKTNYLLHLLHSNCHTNKPLSDKT